MGRSLLPIRAGATKKLEILLEKIVEPDDVPVVRNKNLIFDWQPDLPCPVRDSLQSLNRSKTINGANL